VVAIGAQRRNSKKHAGGRGSRAAQRPCERLRSPHSRVSGATSPAFAAVPLRAPTDHEGACAQPTSNDGARLTVFSTDLLADPLRLAAQPHVFLVPVLRLRGLGPPSEDGAALFCGALMTQRPMAHFKLPASSSASWPSAPGVKPQLELKSERHFGWADGPSTRICMLWLLLQ